MKIVIQKVKQASVTVDSKVVSSIQKGLLLLVGISVHDTEEDIKKMSTKLLTFRIFEDDTGSLFKRNVQEAQGQILSVSQFTLLARTKKGTKPDFHLAAKGEYAKDLYNTFVKQLRAGLGEDNVKDGVFGAMMDVALINDGPVTINLDSKE